jgi:hypothetical protein
MRIPGFSYEYHIYPVPVVPVVPDIDIIRNILGQVGDLWLSQGVPGISKAVTSRSRSSIFREPIPDNHHKCCTDRQRPWPIRQPRQVSVNHD